MGITVDQTGTVYVADRGHKSVVIFTANGNAVDTWPAGDDPFGIDINLDGVLYVGQYQSGQTLTFSRDGELQPVTLVNGDPPAGLAIGPNTDVYVAIPENTQGVQQFEADGTPVGAWLDYDHPMWTAAAANGDVYVTDQGTQEVYWMSATGGSIGKWGNGGTGDGEFQSPFGITVDAAGFVYVVDQGNQRLQKFTASGDFVAVIADASDLATPIDVAVSRSGMVYITDPGGLPGEASVIQLAPA